MGDLQEIDGLGNTAESQLNDIGIHTINDLANADLDELEERGIRSAEKIHEQALKMGIQVKDGDMIKTEQDNRTYITTGMQPVDNMLGGGLQGGFLIGVSGASKAGKTQFTLQCLATAADYHGNAIYIETEPNRFDIGRVKSLTRKEDSYQRIHKIEAWSADEEIDNLKLQRNAYDAVKDTFDNVALVVVDSFIANFRLAGFGGRSELPERNSKVANHLEGLQSLSNTFDCPVLLTLQVQGNPDQYSGGDYSLWGPVLMDHTITYLLHMSHAKGELRSIEMKGNPSMGDGSVTIKIPEDSPLEAVE